MRNSNRFVKLKLVAAFAAVLLAKLLWDRRFGRSGNAGSDTSDGHQQQTQGAPTVQGEGPGREGRGAEGEDPHGGTAEHDDELRVLRSEEELRAGTRERQAGAVNVRKTVRTDRESVEVPTRHEEVSVERVPLSGEASETEIGEDEVDVPVTEEEAVVSKRPVVKEEVRIRKDVVEETEVVEEDVRREEIDVEDDTTRNRDT
jgi:uncharacterized protein (TIGR02271 family)